MKAAGMIRDYAVFGAIAQMRYTEPVATLDADMLVLPIRDSGLDALSPIYRYCEARDTSRRARPYGWATGLSSLSRCSVYSPKRPSDRRRQATSKGSRCA